MAPKIIIGYDPSLGEDSLAFGAAMAQALDAGVVVATAFQIPHDMAGPEDLEHVLSRDSRAGFAIARERLSGLEVETRALADRSVAEALYRLAEEERASLIVLGSSHRGTPGRLASGSVAESAARGAPCAVAVAPHGYASDGDPGLRRLTVAFDGSAESWAALETGIGIAERTGAELTVLTVAEPPRYGYASAWSVLSAGEIRDFDRESKERVVELAAGRVPLGLQVHGRLLTGYPGPALLEASDECDLMIVGSRGYGPLRRTVLGSTTRELLRAARCPVLVLPRGVSIDPLHARLNGNGAARTTANAAPA